MKKTLKIFLSVAFCLVMFVNTSFSVEDINWIALEAKMFANKISTLLPEGVKRSKAFSSLQRGEYIGSSCVEISNEGYGTIGIYADTLAHVAVKKIQMKIFLDRWDEGRKDWINVKEFKFTYEAGSGEILNSASESFTVDDQPAGYRYRVRGLHGVWTYDGKTETHGTMTNGVLITNGPA